MDTADFAEYLDAQQTQMPPSVLERLPQAAAKKMSLAMVRRSRALMSHQLAPKVAADVHASQSPVADDEIQESLGSSHDIIAAAHAADKTPALDLDCMCLSTTTHAVSCVMIQVSKLPDDQHPKYREVMIALFMLLIVCIDSAQKTHADAKYCLFLSNVGSSSENRPSLQWLRTFHAQLPHEMRKKCMNVFIYMPSLAMRAFMGTARLFLSSKFFKKIINLTSEAAAGEYFDTASQDFISVTRTAASVISAPSLASFIVTDALASFLAADDAKHSQPNDSTDLQHSNEQPQLDASTSQISAAQPLVTRFRNVNGKPVLRFAVPLGQLSWATPFAAYAPTAFTSEGFSGSVRSSIRSAKNPLGQADPEDIHEIIHGFNASAFDELRESEDVIGSLGVANAVASTALGMSRRLRFSHTGTLARNDKGYPLNPTGRTGLCGRAHHLFWGPNHSALPVIARCSRGEGHQHLQLLMTKESAASSGGVVWSLLESTVPAGHIISPQLLKELEEQALNRVDLFDELSQQEICGQFQKLFVPGCAAPDNVLHAGVWDQPGNTDHSWTEALCVLALLEERLADCLDYGCVNGVWVPYDPSMLVSESHRPLVCEAVLRLSQRGVCDAHGNVQSQQGLFSLSASLAGLEKAASSVFAMDAFPEEALEDERRLYEELEKTDGLYAESTVEARQSLVVRYRKVGNARAAKALEALDRTDIAGGVESFPQGNREVDSSSGTNSAGPDLSSQAASESHQGEFVDSMRRLYTTRVRALVERVVFFTLSRIKSYYMHILLSAVVFLALMPHQVKTLGLHDPLTVSLRKVRLPLPALAAPCTCHRLTVPSCPFATAATAERACQSGPLRRGCGAARARHVLQPAVKCWSTARLADDEQVCAAAGESIAREYRQ
jgi:hypothetical protein